MLLLSGKRANHRMVKSIISCMQHHGYWHTHQATPPCHDAALPLSKGKGLFRKPIKAESWKWFCAAFPPHFASCFFLFFFFFVLKKAFILIDSHILNKIFYKIKSVSMEYNSFQYIHFILRNYIVILIKM